MSAYLLVFNPTSSPQQTDDEGRILGAGEFGAAHRPAAVVKAALDAGRLVEPALGDHIAPEVAKELDRVAELERRSAAFANLDDARLRRLAGDLELDTDVLKAELVHALVMHPSAQVPTKTAAKEA